MSQSNIHHGSLRGLRGAALGLALLVAGFGVGPAGAAEAGAASQNVKPAPAKVPVPKLADIAGRYAVLREKTKDTGCMVTLDEKARGPKGSLKAHLAPACRDQGIVIFDPVGWQLRGGRLVLTARKGHTTKLDLQEDGSWMKDPSEGKSLSLKKM